MESSFDSWMVLAASGLFALALLTFAEFLTGILTADRGDDRRGSTFEVGRRQAIRKASKVYRWFEPVVDDWAAVIAEGEHELRRDVEQQLRTLADAPPWSPEEFLATGRLRAILTSAVGGGCFGALLAWFSGWVILLPLPVLLGLVVTYRRPAIDLREEATGVRSAVRMRLPFCVDLIALILHSGGTFPDALASVISQLKGTRLATHLGMVLFDTERGVPRARALALLSERLNMEEVNDLVFAVRQGEELGIPLAQTLAVQARQMRLRWAQAIEKAAEEAKVKFTWPSIIIMVACMIVILTPWVMSVCAEFSSMV
ncbi:MAG: type II secretion system F family protein [Isosphaeraceae bacterium]